MAQKKKMTWAIQIYYISLIFGAFAVPFLSGSLLKYVALLVLATWALYRFKTYITTYDLLFGAYVLIMFFSIIYSLNFDVTKQRIITNVQFLVLLIATGSFLYSEKEINQLKLSLVWASRITAGVLLLVGGTGADRILLNGSLLAEDPNYLNGYFLFGTIYAFQTLMVGNKKQKVISVIELLLYIYCCLATGSRGGMFGLFLAALVALFISNNGRNFLKNNIKKLSAVLAISIIIILIIPFIPETVISRFTAQAIKESNGTHRYEFWGWAFQIFKDSSFFHQLFGYGAGAIRTIFGSHGYLAVVAHNLYVEQLMEGGVILSIIYFVMIGYLLKKSYKRKDSFSFSIVCGFLMLSMSTSLYAFKPFWAIMMFINLRRETDNTITKRY